MISKATIILILCCVGVRSEVSGAAPMYDPLKGSIQECDIDHPCPNGYTCAYSTILPTIKVCYMSSLQPRTGECPGIMDMVPVSQMMSCVSDDQCPFPMKCCYAGSFRFMCMTPITLPVSTQPRVIVLENGVNEPVAGKVNWIRFRSSLILVQSGGRDILFDTGSLTQKQELVNSLMLKAGLEMDEIDMVVMSHGHPDHYSNQNLFIDTPQFYGVFRIEGDEFFPTPLATTGSRYFLFDDQNLELIATPGHTLQDVSMIVRNTTQGTVALVGDLFLDSDDETEWPPFSQDTTRQRDSRKTVACLSDYIVPGHGPMFQVTTQMKQRLTC